MSRILVTTIGSLGDLHRLRETYSDLMNAAKDADFMIAGEIVYAARLVAEKLRLRWASSALSPFSFLSAYDPSAIAVFTLIKFFLANKRIHQIYGIFKYLRVSVILAFDVECLDAYQAEDVLN